MEDEILRSLGRIEGRMDEISNLSSRVRSLEIWQAWLKGGWAVMVACVAYVGRGLFGGVR
jgi:hypothetical protein